MTDKIESSAGTWHVVCYSGGETSGIVALEVARKFGTDRMILVNHDIHPSVEDKDIKRFKEELASHLGVPITYANMDGWDTKDQFDVCLEGKAFKAGLHPLCTSRLKTRPFHKWLHKNFPVDPVNGQNDQVVIYYGFENGEPKRINLRRKILASMGYASAYPLAEWPRTYHSTTDVGVDPPKTYEVWKHANCTGCLRAGRQHWYVVYCRRPDIYEKAKKAEETIGYSIIKGAYLKDLEPKFAAMKAAGLPADEKMKAGAFWALARRMLDVSPEEDAGSGGCSPEHLEIIEAS